MGVWEIPWQTHPSTVAFILLALLSIMYAYTTVWLLLMPFVDGDQWIHAYFPDYQWAVGTVVVCSAVLGVGTLAFTGLVMILCNE